MWGKSLLEQSAYMFVLVGLPGVEPGTNGL